MSDHLLLGQLASEREHVLRAVEGLTEDDMHRVMVPSGWPITRLITHLTFDDEMFWISAVIGADPRAIASLRDGWAPQPMSGAEAVAAYRHEIAASDAILASADLDSAPLWWPPAEVFGGPPMRDAREVVFRVLTETSVHAGHLDIVRELIDGHQDLVVG